MWYVPGTILNTLYTFINLVLNRTLQLSPFADEEIKLQCSKLTCSRLILSSQAFSTALPEEALELMGGFLLPLPLCSFSPICHVNLTFHYHVSFFKTSPNNSITELAIQGSLATSHIPNIQFASITLAFILYSGFPSKTFHSDTLSSVYLKDCLVQNSLETRGLTRYLLLKKLAFLPFLFGVEPIVNI